MTESVREFGFRSRFTFVPEMNSVLHAVESTTADTTPILDSGVLPARHRGGIPKALAAGLVIGVALMEALTMLGGMWRENWPAIFLILLVLAIAIHEFGHLIAGWAVGFCFDSIHVGPFSLENWYGVLRARISTDITFLGYAAMFADNVRKLRRRCLIYFAAGPASNTATFIIVVVVSHLVPSNPNSGFETALRQLAAISLVLAMISLVPITSTDGALIEMLLSSPFESRRFLSTMALGSQFNQGRRPRDWKQTWVRAATSIPDKSTGEFYANWMAYLVANDRKQSDFAAQHLERCLELAPLLTSSLRDLVAQEAAVFTAWFRTDSNLAERWLRQVKILRSLGPVLKARTEVALHCARHEFDKAIRTWDRGFDLVQKLPTTPANRALLESLIEWRTEIKERQLKAATGVSVATASGAKLSQ